MQAYPTYDNKIDETSIFFHSNKFTECHLTTIFKVNQTVMGRDRQEDHLRAIMKHFLVIWSIWLPRFTQLDAIWANPEEILILIKLVLSILRSTKCTFDSGSLCSLCIYIFFLVTHFKMLLFPSGKWCVLSSASCSPSCHHSLGYSSS